MRRQPGNTVTMDELEDELEFYTELQEDLEKFEEESHEPHPPISCKEPEVAEVRKDRQHVASVTFVAFIQHDIDDFKELRENFWERFMRHRERSPRRVGHFQQILATYRQDLEHDITHLEHLQSLYRKINDFPIDEVVDLLGEARGELALIHGEHFFVRKDEAFESEVVGKV